MKKNLSPEEVRRIAAKLAFKRKLSITAYAVDCGLSHNFFTHLKKEGRDGISLNAALKLGVAEVVKV